MTEPDELRSTLDEIASMIDVGDPDVARSDISALVQRRRRWRTGVGFATVVLVVIAGISVISLADRSGTPTVLVGVDPSTPASTVAEGTLATTSVPATSAPATSAPIEAPAPPAEPRTVQAAAVGGVPIDANPLAQDNGGGFIAPWRDGFLTVGYDLADGSVAARFSADGVGWEPIEIALPEGVLPRFYTVGGDRLVAVDSAPGRSTIAVYSSSDLVTWSAQTIEPTPPPIELPEFAKPTLRAWGIVANDTGWIVQASEDVRLDARGIVPAEDLPDTDAQAPLYDGVDVDENGVTVLLRSAPDSSPLQYSWDELGVDAEQYEYIRQGANSGYDRWWSAAWDTPPVPATGTGVPTAEGFVNVASLTQFSTDGVNWTPSSSLPLADEMPVTRPYGDGIVVVGPGDETSTLFRLDARGTLIEEIVIEGLAPVRIPFSAFPWSSSSALVYSSTDVPQPLQVLENDRYRLSYDPAAGSLELVDLATDEIIVAEDMDTFNETGVSALVWNEDGITIADTTSGEVIVTFPPDLVSQSMEDISNAVSQFVADLHLLATADGDQFVAVDLPDDSSDEGMYQSVVNGTTALVGINGAWTRYDLG